MLALSHRTVLLELLALMMGVPNTMYEDGILPALKGLFKKGILPDSSARAQTDFWKIHQFG